MPDVPEHPFRTISSRVAYANPWIQLHEHEVEVVASGHRFPYSFLSSGPSVMVVAVTGQGQIVLVKQYRYPSKEYAYELPGGGSKGLSVRRAARNELREETGYTARHLRKLGDYVVYCGLSNEVCHVFLAHGLRSGNAKLEQTEHLRAELVDYERLRKMIRGGEFRDGMGLAALRLAEPELEKLLKAEAPPQTSPQGV
jgi:8-oxo-dGTP pyrophosphatase MutT (NUDIX family)